MTNIAGEFGFKSNDTGMDAIGISMQDLGAQASLLGSTSITPAAGLGLGVDGQNFDTLDA